MELDIKTVEVSEQIKLPYVERGDSSGVPLLLLHGYADSWHSFELVLPHLPESIHTFALTQRGHGDASQPETGYRTRDFEEDLAAFMDKLNLNEAFVAGGSSCGFVARSFAIDHPDRTLGLVLIGSPLTLRDKPSVLEIWESTISKLTDPIDPAFVREFTEGILAQPVSQAFLDTMMQENMKVPARVWKATFEGLLEDDSLKELNKITAPTLIIWGDQDAIVPKIDQDAFEAAIPDSRLVIYPGAGHAVYWEEPARFASDITAFIEDIIN